MRLAKCLKSRLTEDNKEETKRKKRKEKKKERNVFLSLSLCMFCFFSLLSHSICISCSSQCWYKKRCLSSSWLLPFRVKKRVFASLFLGSNCCYFFLGSLSASEIDKTQTKKQRNDAKRKCWCFKNPPLEKKKSEDLLVLKKSAVGIFFLLWLVGVCFGCA